MTNPAHARAADLFKVLSSPVRVGALVAIADEPRSVAEIADIVGVSQTLMSQHLRVLRLSGAVTTESDGQRRTYQLRDEHVAHIVFDAITHAEEEIPDDDHGR